MKKKSSLFDGFRDHISLPRHDRKFRTDPKDANIEYKKSWGFELKPDLYRPIEICWSEKGRGFGQYTFWQEDGKIYCQNECDSKASIKRVLCRMVDNAIFEDQDIVDNYLVLISPEDLKKLNNKIKRLQNQLEKKL
jgi:hypothetical protein